MSLTTLLQGRRVLITGGARGLGLAFAEATACAGAMPSIFAMYLAMASITGSTTMAAAMIAMPRRGVD